MFEKLAHLVKGKDAETAAACFLQKQGLKIISKNKSYKVGEIDIIAEDSQGLIFVEVKYRSGNTHGSAAEMVSPQKQLKLQKAALAWIQENDPGMLKPCRFDVIAITGKGARTNGFDENHAEMEWIKNAF